MSPHNRYWTTTKPEEIAAALKAAKLANKQVLVEVDVGCFDRNKDVAEQYAPDILKKGIPSVALLRADGSVVYRTTGGELADARKMKREGVTAFFVTMLGRG